MAAGRDADDDQRIAVGVDIRAARAAIDHIALRRQIGMAMGDEVRGTVVVRGNRRLVRRRRWRRGIDDLAVYFAPVEGAAPDKIGQTDVKIGLKPPSSLVGRAARTH